MNFTAQYLEKIGKKIYDESGIEISTITYEKGESPYKFKKPSIIYDILNLETPEKQPVLREIKSEKELDALGYVVCSVPSSPEMRAVNKRWRVMMALLKKGSREELSAKKLTWNSGYYVVIDEANLRIRGIGEKFGPLGESEWVKL